MTAPIDHIAEKQRQDFYDQQNEVAGRETGRRARFLPNATSSVEAERKKREERQFRTQLEMLLKDPIYRAKYESVMDTLRDAERATEAALANLERFISSAEQALAEIEKRAARLPDGTRVYRDDEGAIRREDGSIVEGDLAATILWNGDEPSYEEWLTHRDHLAALNDQHHQAEVYQNDILGAARDRMEDPDKPPTVEELDDILANIEQNMPTIVREQKADTSLATEQTVKPTAISLPDLGKMP